MRKLKIKRQISPTNPKVSSSRVMPIEYGGLGFDNLEDSINNLNYVKTTDLNTLIPIHLPEGSIDLNDIALEDFIKPILVGPSSVYYNTECKFTIGNYDSYMTYQVSTDYGSISIDGKTIKYKGPDISCNQQYIKITINGYVDYIKLNTAYIDKPSIKNKNNNDFIEKGGLLEFSDYTVKNGYIDYQPHGFTDIQLSLDENFTDLVVDLKDNVSYKTSYNIPNTLLDEYYVRIRFGSTKGMYSVWSNPIKIIVFQPHIETPSITSPYNNSTLPNEVKFTGTAPSILASSHGFLKAEWQISTNNAFIEPIIIMTDNAYSLTTNLDANKYYVRVRYLADHEDLKDSNWSDVIYITVIDAEDDGSGRLYYRHNSGMGTVVIWVDKQNIQHKTLVLDAAYRSILPWGNPSNYNFAIEGMKTYSPSWYYISNNTPSADNTVDTPELFNGITQTDAKLNALSYYFEDENSSKQNTDIMMQNTNLNSTSYAAGWCRSRLIDGVGADLPNLQTLIRIWTGMFKFDELDPTPDGNGCLFTRKRSKLSYNWNNSSYAWSSTLYTTSQAWILGYSTICTYYADKSSSFLIIPTMDV